jgi:hypothetical protein
VRCALAEAAPSGRQVAQAVGSLYSAQDHGDPVFARLAKEQRIEKAPTLEVIKRQPREIVLSALLRMGEQAPFYIFTAFAFAYGTTTLKASQDFLLTAVLTAALIAEAFTARLRYSGASLGYQLASVIAGGPAPLIATAISPVTTPATRSRDTSCSALSSA